MKRSFLEDVLATVSRCFIVLIIAVVICIAFSGVRVVKSGEVAIVLRFGKIVGDTAEEQIHKPGLLLTFPYFIDEVVTVPTDNVIQQTVERHYTYGNILDWKNSGYLITGDQNIALVSTSVKYTVSDPVAYALYINRADKMIDACVSNAMLETAAYTDVDAILTSGKEQYVGTVIEEAQRKLDAAGTGITLQAIELTNVSMPEEVRYVYEQVNASTVEASTMIENAKQYRNTIIPQAESVANLTVQSAHTAYAYGVSGATNSLNEFWGVLEEYQASPDVVRARIYREKMVRALSTIGKIRVVTDDDSKIVISGE
jgi:membrane protease subunit HflK